MTAHRRIASTAVALIGSALLAASGAAPAAAGERAEDAPNIIGGSTAPAAGWPSIAHIKAAFVENGQGFTSSCGGTVVAPHWVVTAAHCTFGEVTTLTPDQMTVVTGRSDLTTGAGQNIGVTEIRRHPGYTAGGLGNDIALLRLATATSATPMEMAVQANVPSYSHPSGTANTAGWGWTIPGNQNSSSTTLMQTFVPLRENGECANALAAVGPFNSATMVCAGLAQANGTTTCHGDSGGPLVLYTGSPARQVLWGVVNWGKPDCSGGISAFARVTAFTSFLQPAFDEVAAPAAPVTTPPVTPPPPPVPPQPQPQTQVADTAAPRLDRFVIPAIVRIRRGQPTRAITITLRCTERATINVYLLRRVGARFVQQPRSYRVTVTRGTSRMTLPRSIWRMRPGAYRLRFIVTDAAANTRSYHAAIRVRGS